MRVFMSSSRRERPLLSRGPTIANCFSKSEEPLISLGNGTSSQNKYFAYGSDSWRATKRLTVNLGLRWDRITAFVPEQESEAALEAMRGDPLGRQAARIGGVTREHPGIVVARTPIGGKRILDLPFGESLPRIC